MPNEFDTNKNQLDLFSYAESKQNQQDKRQNLASSGFTATVWTLSGVVLAACSLFEDDEGLGGGSVSVNASPVRDARLYFDINGDGIVNEEDVRIQNEQYPGGFTTDSDGRATGIPIELLGRPYIADLNGAVDDATEHPLEGQYHSLEDEDGNHLIASPITALIAEAMADTNQPNTVSGVVAAFTPSGVDATELLEELRSRDSYLPGTESSERVIALSKYLAHNQIREVVGREDTTAEQIAESQRIIGAVESGLAGSDAIVVLNEDTDNDATNGVQLAPIEIGEHDSYVGIINAFAQDGSPLTYTLTNQDGTATDAYTIDDRGGIRVADDSVTPTNMNGTFRVRIEHSSGDPSAIRTVEVTIIVDTTVHELTLPTVDGVPVDMGSVEENILGSDADPLITGIGIDVSTGVTAADFEIRDNALGVFADKFQIEQNGADPTEWNLVLKDGEWLDYEAIPRPDNGEIELDISVANTNGDHSNTLTVTIMVGNVDDITFDGTLRANLREDVDVQANDELIAEGEVTIANNLDANGNPLPVGVTSGSVADNRASDPDVTELTLTYGTFTYDHTANTWSYVVDNELAAVQALKTGETLTEIVTLTIDEPGSSIIEHTRSITLNILGANEDVHYIDAVTRNRVGGSDKNIEIGDPAINGMLDLGNVFDGLMVQNQLAGSTPPTVTFAETDNADVLARQNLFTLSSDGDLVFVGNDDDVANLLGAGIALDLVISAPDDTNEPIPFRLSINVVNEDDDGPAAYEIMGEVRENVALSVMRVSDDPDTLRGTETYQWFLGDESNPVALLGTGPTYTVTAADLASGETIGVAVSYTDGSGTTYDGVGGNPNPIYAFASPVSFTSPAPGADRRIDLDEDTPANSTAHFTVQATSEDDAGAPVGIASYELLDENRDVVSEYKGFTINSSTGVITLTGSLDYEMDDVITLRVRATDENSPAETATLTLTVNVGDVNDNAPAFTQATYTADIDETLGNGAEVARVSARDDDGTTANNTVGYSITAGNTNNVFDIDDNGVITVLDASELDFETTPSYTLTITATDNGSPAMTDTATVTITVNDINDEPPMVNAPAGTIRTTTGNPANTNTGYSITVTDADAEATNDFRVDSDDRRFIFERDGATSTWNLVLLPNQAVSLGDFTLGYTATDGANTDSGTVTISAVDSSVSFDAGRGSREAPPITEGTVTASDLEVIIAASTVTAGDPAISYAITAGDPGGIFALSTDGNGNRILTLASTTTSLDHESVPNGQYQVEITATEDAVAGTGNTAIATITVIVNDVEEGEANYIVAGNVQPTATLTAQLASAGDEDPDGRVGAVTYRWFVRDAADADPTSITDTNSAITWLTDASSAADANEFTLPSTLESGGVYGVAISYLDGYADGSTPRGDATFLVELASAVEFLDADSNVLTDSTYRPDPIAENTDSLPTVTARLETATFTYAIESGNDGGIFEIGGGTGANGAISVVSGMNLDFEAAEQHTLTIRVDEVGGDAFGFATVIIRVSDVNEHKPVFATDPALSTGTDEIAEDAANGTRVGLFRATDADGSNNAVTYSLDDGGLGIFDIQAVDGTNNWEIYVADNTNLNFESATKSYTIEITASDGAEPAMTTTEAFTINITDVEDSDPTATTGGTQTFAERAAVTSDTETGFFITISDDDTDAVNDHGVMVIGTHASRFKFVEDGTTANQWNLVLIDGQEVDREAGYVLNNLLTVEYQITDGTRFTSQSNSVGLTITDINDNKPVIPDQVFISTYASGVPESAGSGALFANDGVNPGVLLVNDDDLNQSFTYRIVSIDGVAHGDITNPIFAIQPTSGRFGLIGKLDYETAQSHSVVFEVTDQGGMVSEHKAVVITVLNADDGPAVFEVNPTQANDKILEVEVATADDDGLNGTYSYQWFTTTDNGVTQVDISGENGRRFDTSGRTDPTGTVIGVRVEYTDNAGTRYTKDGAGDDEVAPFAVNTTLRFTESYSITLTDGDASPTLPVFADDLELNGDAITTGLEFTFATDGNPGNLFTLSSAGVLTFTGSAVDFDMATDAEKSFNLLIVAEATAGGETTTAIIPVTVEDVNDNDPTLSEPFDTADVASDPRTTLTEDSINENMTGATTSISFEASDADTVFSGAGQTALEFTITATAGTTDAQDIADMFEMAYDSTNDIYTLRLKDGMALNAEAAGLTTNSGVQQIELRIQATDGRTDMPTATPTAGQGLSDARTVTITVNDVNDVAPVFTETAVTQSIEENAAASPVSNANPASDGDATAPHNTIIYSIVSGNNGGFFSIDAATGVVSTTQALDHESADLLPGGTNRGYVLTLQAVDEGGLQAPEQQTLTIRVVDVNEAPVLGVSGSRTGTMSETDTETGIILTLDDPDAADQSIDASRFTFSDARFTVMKVAGNNNQWEVVLKPGESVNYETAADRSIALTVSVTDRATSGMKSNEETITVTVENANDESPTFADPVVTWETAFANGIIPETTDGSTTRVLVGRVAISDDDGATAFLDDRVFSIAGAGTKFEIERDTTTGEGLIYLTGALDREGVGADDAEYDAVKITVTDGTLPAVTSDAFSIFIDDVNEGDPVIAVSGSPASFTERTASGNEATGVTFTISDADTGSTYTSSEIDLSGDSRFDFVWDEAMQSGTVVLKDTETLDYETAADRAITLTLTVTDPLDASVTDTETITINVGNADDVASEFADFDVSYWQAGTGSGVAGEEHIRTIAENQGSAPILVMSVSDPDTATASLTPTIQGGSPVDASNNPIFSFGILNNQAILSVLSSRLDYETAPNTYTLVLEVSDGTNTPAATQTVTINVGNVNEHGPAFGADLVDFETGFANGIVPENTAEGTVIGVVDVSDADGDVLTVTVLPDQGATQALADKFEVVYNMMDTQYELRLKTALDLEGATPDPSSAFGLRLRATDGTTSVDSPADTGSLIVISIGNVDDADPVFNDTHIDWNVGALNIRGVDANTIAVFEYVVDGTTTSGAPAGRKLADLAASDPDTSGALAYSIDNGPQIGGVDIFEIGGANNDELLLKTALDYEAAEDLGGGNRGYTLTLTVSDGRMGVNPVSHEVTIRVLNADEGRAVFAPLTSSGDVTAPAVGDELTFTPTPTTADPDGNPVAPNTFTRTWYRENPDGTGLDTITNASDTYTITSADVGKIVGVIVNYIDGGGTEYLGTAGVRVELANVVASDFEVTGGTSGMADQYDASAVDATGTLMFGTASAAKVNDAGTYTIVTDGTYGTAEVVDGVWTYNVDNTNATIKALASGDTQKDTFTIGVPLTGGTTQNVEVEVTITGQTSSEITGSAGEDKGRAIADNTNPDYPGNPLDRAASTTFDVIQGGDLDDEIYAGTGGSLIFAGHGQDTITLSTTSAADIIVYRFQSKGKDAVAGSGQWIPIDGGDTINNFEHGVDKIIFVDTNTKMIPDPDDSNEMIEVPDTVSITEWKDYTFGNSIAKIGVKYLFSGTDLQGLSIAMSQASSPDGPDGPSTSDSGRLITINWHSDSFVSFLSPDDGEDVLYTGTFITSSDIAAAQNQLVNYAFLPSWFNGQAPNTAGAFQGLEIVDFEDLMIDILNNAQDFA